MIPWDFSRTCILQSMISGNLFICQSISNISIFYLSIHLHIYLSSIYLLSIHLSICLSVCLPIVYHLPTYLSICSSTSILCFSSMELQRVFVQRKKQCVHQDKVILAVVKLEEGVQLGSCYETPCHETGEKLRPDSYFPSFLPRSCVSHEHGVQHSWLSSALLATNPKGSRGCHQGLILQEHKKGQTKTEETQWTHRRQETIL